MCGLGAIQQLAGEMMLAQHIRRAGSDGEDLGVVRVIAQQDGGEALDLGRAHSHDQTHPVAHEGGSGPRRIVRPQRVRDRHQRIGGLPELRHASMTLGAALGILASDLDALPGERAMPAVDDTVRRLEPVEEEPEPHAVVEQRRRISTPGHSAREVWRELMTDGGIEHELSGLVRQRAEHVVAHVVAEERGCRRGVG